MTVSEDLQWRNLIKDKTFEDVSWLDTPKTFYLGVDCSSSDSMTIGNLAVFMTAKRLLDAGWKTVLLAGGATSLIGDPGGKNEERPLKSREEIEHNVAGIKTQVQQLFEGKDFTLVDNYDWFKDVMYLEFLRDVGKHFSMTELVQRDFIAERMGEGGGGISYAEFSYTLIQGYDFWHLHTNYDVVLQIGGSDQWGNMLSGIPLIRKKSGTEAHAFSMPLVINKATGAKFGKSEAGAVWLDPEKTSPTQFYQFWLNVDDEGVEDYLKVYTELGKPEVEDIIAQHTAAPEKRHAQRRLAQEVTTIVHGKETCQLASDVTEYITGSKDVKEASDTQLSAVRRELASATLSLEATVIDGLTDSGLASSRTEARRLLEGGSVYVNGEQITDNEFSHVLKENGRLLLRKGKTLKNTALIEFS